MVFFSKPAPVVDPPAAGPMALDPVTLAEMSRLLKYGAFIGNNGSVCDDVWIEAMALLDLADLASLRLVSKSLRRMVSVELNSRFIKMLVTYVGSFERASAFRELMDASRSVVGGSEALRFVRPATWVGKNLDLFTPRDVSQDFVRLLTSWGAKVVSARDVPSPGVNSYLESRRDTAFVVTLDLDGNQINLIESRTGTAMHAVLDSWSTVLMNVVTARCAMVPFPHLTFDGVGLYNGTDPYNLRRVAQSVVHAYEECGYQHFDTTIYGDFGTVCMSNWWAADKSDRVCLVPFDYTDTSMPPEFDDGLGWRISNFCRVVGCPHKRDIEDAAVSILEWVESLRA